jgi:hypothetical protein
MEGVGTRRNSTSPLPLAHWLAVNYSIGVPVSALWGWVSIWLGPYIAPQFDMNSLELSHR